MVGTGTVAEHSPVISARVGATGSVTSSITTFCVCMELFPFPSSKFQVTTVVPCAVIGKVVVVVPVIVPSQLSVAVGAVIEATEHSAVTSAREPASGTGAVTSSTITV